VEAGITEVWNLLVSGRLKVMASLTNWIREFRKYHRDDKGSGKIVKRDDHMMDATRYLIISGRTACVPNRYPPVQQPGLLTAARYGCKAALMKPRAEPVAPATPGSDAWMPGYRLGPSHPAAGVRVSRLYVQLN
jgi:hypothetical protein